MAFALWRYEPESTDEPLTSSLSDIVMTLLFVVELLPDILLLYPPCTGNLP